MTPRWKFWLIGGLVIAVLAAAIYFPILRRGVKRAAKLQQQSEEQARRELTQPIVINPGDPRVKTKLFWASDTIESTLVPVTVELPLSNDPVLRSKQVLNTLLAGPVDAELRTLPPDALRRFAACVLSIAGWNGDRGFFRGAGDFHSVRHRERAIGCEFHHPDAGSQRSAGAAAENPDSWAGSGNAGRTSGSGGGICRQHEASSTAGEARANAIQHGQTGDASVG
jgi:hypothetical protein